MSIPRSPADPQIVQLNSLICCRRAAQDSSYWRPLPKAEIASCLAIKVRQEQSIFSQQAFCDSRQGRLKKVVSLCAADCCWRSFSSCE